MGSITPEQIADLAYFIARMREIRAVARWHCPACGAEYLV
jgi:hypothetical protein